MRARTKSESYNEHFHYNPAFEPGSRNPRFLLPTAALSDHPSSVTWHVKGQLGPGGRGCFQP